MSSSERRTGNPAGVERRVAPRGRLTVLLNIIYGGLRKLGVRITSVYVTLGVFLTVGAIIAVIATIGFAELAEHVLAGGTQAFDVGILKWLHARQSPAFDRAAIELTYLGTGVVVMAIVGVTTLFLWHTEHKISAKLLLAATIGSIALNNVLKLLYHRPRPSVFEWQQHAMSSSFPSGHAMSATVVYGTVAYLLMRLQKHRWSRVLTFLGTVVLILSICLTRLYLGVHYPSDVMGGIIVGLAWAAFCMATLEAFLAVARRKAPAAVAEEERPAPTEKPQPAS